MTKTEKLDLIRQTGVIAIMRAQGSDQLIAAADAIQAGGVRAIEVTMNTPGALRVIEEASKRYGEEVLFGAPAAQYFAFRGLNRLLRCLHCSTAHL